MQTLKGEAVLGQRQRPAAVSSQGMHQKDQGRTLLRRLGRGASLPAPGPQTSDLRNYESAFLLFSALVN